MKALQSTLKLSKSNVGEQAELVLLFGMYKKVLDIIIGDDVLVRDGLQKHDHLGAGVLKILDVVFNLLDYG